MKRRDFLQATIALFGGVTCAPVQSVEKLALETEHAREKEVFLVDLKTFIVKEIPNQEARDWAEKQIKALEKFGPARFAVVERYV